MTTNKKSPPGAQSGRANQPTNKQEVTEVSHDTHAERNLRLAADIENAGPWSVARLIASSVDISGKGGRPSDNRTPRSPDSKLSRNDAADIMGKAKDTITAYLSAWNDAAADGHCLPSTELLPIDGQSADLPAAHLWEKYRNPNSHSTPRAAQTVPAPAQAARQMTDTEREEFVRSEIKSNPAAQHAARAALDEVYSEAPKPYANTAVERPAVDAANDLIFEFRKLHRGVDAIVQAVNTGTASIISRDAVLREIAWLRTALGYIEDGVKGDNLAQEIAQFLQEVDQ